MFGDTFILAALPLLLVLAIVLWIIWAISKFISSLISMASSQSRMANSLEHLAAGQRDLRVPEESASFPG